MIIGAFYYVHVVKSHFSEIHSSIFKMNTDMLSLVCL